MAHIPKPLACNRAVARQCLVLMIDAEYVSASLQQSVLPDFAWLPVQLVEVLQGTSCLLRPQQLNIWHL